MAAQFGAADSQAIGSVELASGQRAGMSEQIVKRLRKAIEAAVSNGQSYNGIGRDAGVDPAAVWRFVKGERSIDIVIAARIADALGLELRSKSGRKRKGS
jgi:transcriptional regulator with XRE-family HTH domain